MQSQYESEYRVMCASRSTHLPNICCRLRCSYETNVVSGKYGFFDTDALVLLTAPVKYIASLTNVHNYDCRSGTVTKITHYLNTKSTRNTMCRVY